MNTLKGQRPGIVEEIQGNNVKITLNKKNIKSICAEKGCNVCNHDFPQTEILIPRDKWNLKPGDNVVVSFTVLNEALGAFIAFILPLILSVLYYVLVTRILQWEGDSAKTVLSTLGVLLLSLIGLSLIDKIIRLIVPPKIIAKE